jgi:hypothetical protein
MRWFWLFILLLCILTGVLYAQRVRAEQAAQDQLRAQLEAARESATPARRPRRDRGSAEQPSTETPAAAEPEPIVQETADTTESVIQSDTQPEPEPDVLTDADQEQPEVDAAVDAVVSTDTTQSLEIESPQESQPLSDKLVIETETDQTPPDAETASIPEPTGDIVIELPEQADRIAAEDEPAPPSYELRADGSFKVLAANLWVEGVGTEAAPFLLSWDVLKSIQKQYNPKNGNDTLPDWLELLEGKHVAIEGNTLVPVVASSTRELLVMQNPWDGCCIGVPPTPYDAVEVSLDHDVDFGNSAVGYGSVQGVFYADPYVVDGWVLGVYIIEDAKYRSGEGVVFPEF